MRDIEEEKACGSCCWFYNEDAEGWGFCASMKSKDLQITNCCDLCTSVEKDGSMSYVSREYQRHCTAVLAQSKRFYDNLEVYRYMPPAEDVENAIKFAYRYISTMSKL